MARTKQTARRALPTVTAAPDWGAPLHTIRTVAEEEGPVGSSLEFKRVDQVYDEEKHIWTWRDSAPITEGDTADAYRDHCFTVNRQFDAQNPQIFNTTIHIKNPHLRSVLQTVIGQNPAANWTIKTPVLGPQLLLQYIPALDSHLQANSDKPFSPYLKVLLEHLVEEYASTLEQIRSHLSQTEITFQFLWSLYIPQTTLVITCPVTSQPRAVRLLNGTMTTSGGTTFYHLNCEYIDTSCGAAEGDEDDDVDAWEELMTSTPTKGAKIKFGHAAMVLRINAFRGAVKVTELDAYPIRYHPDPEGLTARLIARGRKWMNLSGRHHLHYSGLSFKVNNGRVAKIHIGGGRIMIDKVTFRRINTNYPIPQLKDTTSNDYYEDDEGNEMAADTEGPVVVERLSERDLVLATPILYGFSLSDKLWLEFSVDHVSTIVWNEEAFSNLVLPAAHKSLIKALVESYTLRKKDGSATEFDDFITGKGRGLVINAFGPPGTGKTMSAEATSEHVRKPLYVVGAGDLGDNAGGLDATLTQIFDIAHTWNAVVLIDEADVFLEQRSVHDIHRNALVAVFLRQLEYFSGILFITTNRVKTFDEAFQSRIHVSLRYRDLPPTAKIQIWRAFLSKAGVNQAELGDAEWELLGSKKINGRQIKNAVRTGLALATNRGSRLTFGVLNEVLDVMEQFEVDFKNM